MLMLLVSLLASCSDADERRCRLAVKSLVAAPAGKVPGELNKVTEFGRYALPDIEQEFHSASATGRSRLLDALARLRLPEARAFLEFVARYEPDQVLRERAARLAQR